MREAIVAGGLACRIGQCLLGLLLLGPAASPVQAEETAAGTKRLTFLDHESNPLQRATAEILTSAYERMSIEVVVEFFPLRRSAAVVNAGQYDGELFRVAGAEKKFPNLRMVPTPLGENDFAAFAVRAEVKPTSWASLQPLRVGAQLGVMQVEKRTQGMNVVFEPTLDSAFKLLKLGQVDVVVASRMTACEHLVRLRGSDAGYAGIREVGVLESVPIYHYLNANHADLIPRLDEELKRLTSNGYIAAVWRKASISGRCER
ncbi:transporter substrate-binding domain-containing protein [Chitinimonas arctica]|uniref:Transporter substrate-binding domain-containing protein n=1 Tax=Chitinimonas arctica TaxID=2594795 RepID=A0A516SBT1_9NEIS|nr:transporter substrate-binding domain-containing protein [Chitinimonas arctica]QDQ25609.1 transporter substrate-binding domain-containing protein [Chitinimonas arctica]